MTDQWAYWVNAMQGNFLEDLIQRGNPQSGFYRDKNKRAVAIWRTSSGTLHCTVSSGYRPRHDDEIDELFGWVCRKPITRELYISICSGGAWPEDIEEPAAGIGDNSGNLAPHETFQLEIDNLFVSAVKWLKTIGNKIATQEQADKCVNYANAFHKLEKRADEQRVAEKNPHDDAAKAVQEMWKPIIDLADEKKRWMKKTFEVYALEEQRRREDEARKAAAEYEAAQKAAEEEAAKRFDEGVPMPVPIDAPPPPDPAKNVVAGTRGRVALKKRIRAEIVDLPEFSDYLATMENPASDFVEVCQKVANRIISAGGSAPGIEKKETTYAA